MSKTPATKSIPWRQIQKFAESVALGKSATQAYLDARPGVAYSTANVNGPALAKTHQAQLAVASMRQALIEKATEEFILNRDEILRYHTLTALTPVGEIDESHFLAQEVTYRVSEGFDHYNQKPLFQLVGVNNDYVGEWHTTWQDAEDEHAKLQGERDYSAPLTPAESNAADERKRACSAIHAADRALSDRDELIRCATIARRAIAKATTTE